MENKQNTQQINAEEKVAVSEEVFYVDNYAALKAEESEIKKKIKVIGDGLKETMKEKDLEAIKGTDFTLTLTESTGSQISTVELMQDLGFKIPEGTEEIIEKLFNVNITNAKKELGALQLNKIMKPGRTTQTMRLKKNE